MNINYDIELRNKLDDIKGNTLLLHSCCAPCSSYVLTFLAEYLKITVLYYNPNISPFDEYDKRKKEQIRLINTLNTKYPIKFLDCDYENEKYNELIKGLEMENEGGSRCKKCFYSRLEKTAILAKNNDFDYFATTLTVSPYKNAKLINEIGFEIGNKYDAKYLASDFKKNNGYKISIELSKKYELYRQNYCGCVFSKRKDDLND